MLLMFSRLLCVSVCDDDHDDAAVAVWVHADSI